MKKLLFFVFFGAFVQISKAQTHDHGIVRNTDVQSSDDSSVNRTIKSSVDNLLGSSTSTLMLTKDLDGNAIDIFLLNKGSRNEIYLVKVFRDGKEISSNSYSKKKFDSPEKLYNSIEGNYYASGEFYPRHRRGFLSSLLSSVTYGLPYGNPYSYSIPTFYGQVGWDSRVQGYHR